MCFLWSHSPGCPVKLGETAGQPGCTRAGCQLLVQPLKRYVTVWSSLGKSRQSATRLVPAVRHPGHPARRARAAEQVEQFLAAGGRPLGNNLDPEVLEVLRRSGQPELQRPGPDPPAEADPLDAPGDPHGE